MKSTFPFKPESSEKMVKTSKFVSQEQNRTKKTITNELNEFECFDVRPLHCNFSSFYKKKTTRVVLRFFY